MLCNCQAGSDVIGWLAVNFKMRGSSQITQHAMIVSATDHPPLGFLILLL
jgi:hypothetical protein